MSSYQVCVRRLQDMFDSAENKKNPFLTAEIREGYREGLEKLMKESTSEAGLSKNIDDFFESVGVDVQVKNAAYLETSLSAKKAYSSVKEMTAELEAGKQAALARRVYGEGVEEKIAVEALFEPTPYAVKGSGINVYSAKVAANQRFSSFINSIMTDTRYVKALADPDFDVLIEKAMWDIQHGTIDAVARRGEASIDLASMIIGLKAEWRNAFSEVGRTVKNEPHHIITASHNPSKIRANIPEWQADISKAVDWEKTLGAKVTPDMIAKDLKKFTSKMETASAVGTTFADHKKYIFKRGEFAKYNQKYGNQPRLMDSLVSDSNNASRRIGLMSKFGPNYVEGLEILKKQLGGRQNNLIKEKLKYATGAHEQMTITPFAKAGAVGRTWIASVKLGAAFLTAWNDIPIAISAVQHASGNTRLWSAFNLAMEYSKSIPSAARRTQMSKDFGILLENTAQTRIHSLLEQGVIGSGGMEAYMRAVNKLNGLSLHSNSLRAGVASIISRDLRKGIAKGGAGTKKLLSTYGFSDDMVGVLQSVEGHLNRENIMAVKADSKLKISTANTYLQYLNDTMDRTTARAGVREASKLAAALDVNGGTGTITRMMFQFMGTGFKHSDSIRFYAAQAADMRGGMGAAYAMILAESMAFSYAGDVIRKAARGEDIQSPTDLTFEDIADLMVRTGFAGPIGDVVISNFGKYGMSGSRSLGPVPSEINNLFKLVAKGVSPNKQLADKDVVNFIFKNSPLNSTLYTQSLTRSIIENQ